MNKNVRGIRQTRQADEMVATLTGAMISSFVDIASEKGEVRTRSLLSGDLGEALIDVPDMTAAHYIRRHKLQGTWNCLDFGCGNAPHKGLLEEAGADWIGCDYNASKDPATLARHGADFGAKVVEYDGRLLPFDDAEFDAVWSWQALEHIHFPETTFAEISRVLRPGGVLFGSTSFLEPYHAQSTFSYTPYGFKLISERHGLVLKELAPSMDGFSYLVKRLVMMLGLDDGVAVQRKMTQHSPMWAVRDKLKELGREDEYVHLLAQICGTFRFMAMKADT